MKTILDNIQITLLKMERNLYNPKVNEIKEILSISNSIDTEHINFTNG
jgi:hypothetical protein